jgi:CRP/FNR family transcriptional regulator, cyclic AMP receptor protein
MTKTEILKNVPAFSSLSKAHLEKIARIADEVEVPPGKILARQGEKGVEFFYILEGKAKIKKEGKVADILTPNNFFGEVSIIDGRPYFATVVAETKMKLLVIESRYFDQLLEKTPTLSNEIMRALCTYVRAAVSAV